MWQSAAAAVLPIMTCRMRSVAQKLSRVQQERTASQECLAQHAGFERAFVNGNLQKRGPLGLSQNSHR